MRTPNVLGLCALMLVLASCGSTPDSRFYILSARDARTEEPDGTIVWVGPVVLPDYLMRSEVVSLSTEHSLEVADFDRWAEPLVEGFSRALVLNLGAELPASRVIEDTWEAPVEPGMSVLRVTVTVLRFDACDDGQVRLQARWTLGGMGEAAPPKVFTTSLARPSPGEDIHGQVEVMSALIDDLAQEIAGALRSR